MRNLNERHRRHLGNRPQVKICGNHYEQDLLLLTQYVQDIAYVGFIFTPVSPRYVSPTQVAEWLERYPQFQHKAVGVFLNQELEEVEDVIRQTGIGRIQLHGNESVPYCRQLQANHDVQVWKVIAVEANDAATYSHAYDPLLHVQAYLQDVDVILLDTKVKGVSGGTGQPFDWALIPKVKSMTDQANIPLFIAGGIRADNVRQLLASYELDGIDLASGAETDGYKDAHKIETLREGVSSMSETTPTGAARPDERGRFGSFGGQYVPETLMNALEELKEGYQQVIHDRAFQEEYQHLLRVYSGRPTPLYYAPHLSKAWGGKAKLYLKREDLNHTGAHKMNNALGQALLAKKMGKSNIIAETGAGQHGVATATVAARFGLSCKVFMGEEDMQRQSLNVFRMQLLGAEVIPVKSGTKTLKDATNEAIRYWVTHVDECYYLIGSVVGPHPYPQMVRDFQRIIGDETKQQFQEEEGRLPDALIACVGGGSNAMGMFYPFLDDSEVEMIGVEAAGKGVDTSLHAATITKGTSGVLHGAMTYLLQDEEGQIQEAHSISAGLDYPGVGPEHAFLAKSGRVSYQSATDEEALNALQDLCVTEGILPAIESAHALAEAKKRCLAADHEEQIVVCLSGRGDKDVHTLQEHLGEEND